MTDENLQTPLLSKDAVTRAAEKALAVLRTPDAFSDREREEVLLELDGALSAAQKFLEDLRRNFEKVVEPFRQKPPPGETCGPNGAAPPPMVGCVYSRKEAKKPGVPPIEYWKIGSEKIPEDGDCFTAALPVERQAAKDAAEIATFLQRYPGSVQQEALDHLVHDFKSSEASRINNSGAVGAGALPTEPGHPVEPDSGTQGRRRGTGDPMSRKDLKIGLTSYESVYLGEILDQTAAALKSAYWHADKWEVLQHLRKMGMTNEEPPEDLMEIPDLSVAPEQRSTCNFDKLWRRVMIVLHSRWWRDDNGVLHIPLSAVQAVGVDGNPTEVPTGKLHEISAVFKRYSLDLGFYEVATDDCR